MIHIGIPYIIETELCCELSAKIEISVDTAMRYKDLEKTLHKVHWRVRDNYPPKEWNSQNSCMFFSVEKEYGEYLCETKSDAFVVAMLWYALMTGSDIEFEAPISEKMYFGITEQLIPALCKNRRAIHLIGPVTKEKLMTEKGVGTGMSCGIDSLYTLKKFMAEQVPNDYRLTHLAYFNMGAVFHPNSASKKVYSLEEFYAETDRISEEKKKNALEVANIKGLPLLYVKSNLDKDYYRGAYGYTAVYRNCASVLAVQKLFSKYYCSSAGWPEFFDLSLTEGSEHYETMLCDVFSTESLQFLISDYATRLEKTTYLADDEIANKYLDVCFNFHNCGTCAKCYRTLVTLDVLGKLDSFSQVFDIKKYKENRNKALAWLLEAKNGDKLDDNAVFARDIYHLILMEDFKIPNEAFAIYYKKKLKNSYHKGKQYAKQIINTIRN